MRGPSIPLLLLACLGAGLPHARALSLASVEFSAQRWEFTPTGHAAIGDDGLDGTEVDVQDDLGYDRKEEAWGADFIVGDTHQIELSYLGLDVTAADTFDEQVRFGALVYRADIEVTSSLDATLLRAAYRHRSGGPSVRSGFLLGLQYADVEATLSARSIGSSHEDLQAALPVIGVFAEIEPAAFLAIDLRVAAGAWDWDNSNVTFVDASAAIRLLLYPFFAGFGYRYVDLEGEDTGVPLDVELNFAGPQLLGGFLF